MAIAGFASAALRADLRRRNWSSNVLPVRIVEFEWDDGNELHFALGHGIAPGEAEEVFALAPLYRKTERGHYSVFGPMLSGRLLVIVFELKGGGIARPITGWDMNTAERRYHRRQRGHRHGS